MSDFLLAQKSEIRGSHEIMQVASLQESFAGEHRRTQSARHLELAPIGSVVECKTGRGSRTSGALSKLPDVNGVRAYESGGMQISETPIDYPSPGL